MFFAQLLTSLLILFTSFIYLSTYLQNFFNAKGFHTPFLLINVCTLLSTYFSFYNTYVLNYFSVIPKFYKWTSSNYSDSYWSNFTSRLNQQEQNSILKL